jgi:hypothetical protein
LQLRRIFALGDILKLIFAPSIKATRRIIPIAYCKGRREEFIKLEELHAKTVVPLEALELCEI